MADLDKHPSARQMKNSGSVLAATIAYSYMSDLLTQTRETGWLYKICEIDQ